MSQLSLSTVPLCSENFSKGLCILEKYGLTFDLLLRPALLKHVPKLASKFPNLKMVINHLAKPTKYEMPLELWKAEIDEIAKFPNIYMKLSGMINEVCQGDAFQAFQPFVQHAVEAFGTQRYVF